MKFNLTEVSIMTFVAAGCLYGLVGVLWALVIIIGLNLVAGGGDE